MNSKKFAFIICSNNEIFLNEALYYISHLIIPEGYEVDTLVVKEAVSMTSGYNEAMHASDAKYKIYLHQDVFIIQENFLFRLLEVFKDETIGLVGVVGSDYAVKNAWFASSWDIRATYLCNTRKNMILWDGMETEKDIIEVFFVDGMIMATQYDLEWDEEFDAWDFYDISQSMKFYEAGYKTIIPKFAKEKIVTMHDEGYCVPRHYCKYRKLFCEKYYYYGFKFDREDEERAKLLRIYDDNKKIFLEKLKQIEQLPCEDISQKISWFEEELLKLKDLNVMDTDLSCWLQLVDIDKKEQEMYQESRFWKLGKVCELMQIYHTVKFMIWRMELGKPEEDTELLWMWIKQRLVSVAALSIIVVNTAYKPDECWENCLKRIK